MKHGGKKPRQLVVHPANQVSVSVQIWGGGEAFPAHSVGSSEPGRRHIGGMYGAPSVRITPRERMAPIQTNAARRHELALLREQVAAALARMAELQHRPPDPPAGGKPHTPRTPRTGRRKRAPQHNRARRLAGPTRSARHAVHRCPNCHGLLPGGVLARWHHVIDLPPPPPVEVSEHHVVNRWCAWCRRWHAPRLALQGHVLGQGRVGRRIASRWPLSARWHTSPSAVSGPSYQPSIN